MEIRTLPKICDSRIQFADKNNGHSDMAFKGARGDKIYKSILEKASENGALCASAAALVATCILRPATIMATPGVEKDNKKIASSKSISSGIMGFLFMYFVSTPIADAVKKIDKDPKQFLKAQTIRIMSNGNPEKLTKSSQYAAATRFFKIVADLLCSVPKATLTIVMIPPIMAFVFKSAKKKSLENEIPIAPSQQSMQTSNGIFNKFIFGRKSQPSISFKGDAPNGIFKAGYDKLTDIIAMGIGKIMDTKAVIYIADKVKKSNIEKYMMAITGGVMTTYYVKGIKKSSGIEEKRKTPLIYNAVMSWVLSTIGAFTVDAMIDVPLNKYMDKFKKLNAGDAKLDKYLLGMKILKSALIFGMMYRWIVPWVSTIFAEKMWKANGVK